MRLKTLLKEVGQLPPNNRQEVLDPIQPSSKPFTSDDYEEAQVDNDDRDMDMKHDSEKKITKLIAYAFKRAGVEIMSETISRFPIRYEHDTREATVILEDGETTALKMVALLKTGLADDFVIGFSTAYGEAYYVEFKVKPELDNAVL
jgi:alkanesulfonate monooxygenase SsuD/methylene tetrahydromethanopterin reductase-like flavin-dependent oxidoreductase (luciferase family)